MATNNIKDFRFSIYINNEAARKSLIELEQLSDKYTDTLRRLAAAGKANTAEYTQTKEKLDQVKASMQEMTRQAGLNSLSLSQLTSLKKALNYEFSKAIPGSEKWEKLKSDIQAVNTRMTQLRIQNNQTGLSLKNLAEGANKYIGLITMMIASLTGIVLGIHKTIDAFARWDDKLSDVMKTTGLSKEEVKSLNTELGKIDTRTSQLELLDLARVAGKLGINAKNDVEGFVRAANQIKVALTEDLGGNVEESINQVGKLVEIFKLKDEFGIEESLLKVGSTINALGAASTANEGYMVEFSKRVAGIAPQAGISIDKILGLAATLDQLGQTSEVSSTVFAAVIPDMFKNTADYANIAGMSVGEFSKLLAVDANTAFIAFLDGLNKNKGGLAEMAVKLDGLGLEGKRSISVLGALSNNTKLLTQQQILANQEFVKGTSITNEYNTKNETAQAQLEKARKGFQQMAVELGEKLAPAMTFSTNGLSYFLRALKITIEFVGEHKRTIGTLVIALGAYYTTVKALALIESLRNKENVLTIALTKGRAVAESAGIVVTQAWAAATMLLTGNVKGATQAMRVLNTTIKGSGWGWLVAAIASAITYLVLFREKTDEASKFTEYYNQALERNTEQLVAEQTEFQGLIRQAMKANEGTDLRKKLITEINEKYPGYLENIKEEWISNDTLARMLNNVNSAYSEKFRLIKDNARLEAIQRQYSEKEVEKMKLEDELSNLQETAITPGSDEDKRENQIKDQIKIIEQEQKLMEANMSLIQTHANEIKQNIENITNPSIEVLEKKIKEYEKAWNIFNERAQKAGSQKDKEYYLQQASMVNQDKSDALIKLSNLKKKTKKDKETITTDSNIEVTGGKISKADQKAMEKAKKAELKAWADLQKELDKELEDADKTGTGNDATFLGMKADKEASDKIYDEAYNLANRLRDLKWEETEAINEQEQRQIDFKKKSIALQRQLDEQETQAASDTLGNISSLFAENTAAYQITASLKAVVDTYMAANVALASAPPPFNFFLMGSVIATGLANVAKINSVQFAGGRYPVKGATDGQTYMADYQANPQTGLYQRPTIVGGLGLVGERGSEIVISHPHVKHLQMNYPEVIRTIYQTATRVPQFADGNYPNGSLTSTAQGQKNTEKEDMMITLMSRMVEELQKPTRAYIPYNDLRDKFNEVDRIENEIG